MVDKKRALFRTAEELAKDHRAISVSEFFERNRHLLGYDNPTRALLTVVKEGVDNSLDICEEARIPPRIWVEVKPKAADRYRVMIKDNGPGMIDKQIPLAFGRLLYGSRFHRYIQSRGQQGIGIKGAVLYSQLTTGKPTTIISSTGNGKTSYYELMINIIKNQPEVIRHEIISDGKEWHGLKIEMEVEGRYIEGSRSITEYIKETAISNPYAHITFYGPNGKMEFKRSTNELPPLPKEIKPHPQGVELGILRRMLKATKSKTVLGFLMNDFTRIGKTSGLQICKKARIDPNSNPTELDNRESEKLFRAMQSANLMRPPTDCLSPLGEKLIEAGLRKEIPAEFFTSISRQPSVYRGMPFVVECGIAWGGGLPQEGSVDVLRFANKVPLLYQAGDCAITKAVIDTDWSRYGLKQSGRSLPQGPAVILVHFASVWVPFTSESKEAISSYPEIMKEIKLALQEAGRRLGRYLSGKRRIAMHQRRIKIFEMYIPEVANSLEQLTNVKADEIKNKLLGMLEKRVKIDDEKIGSEETN